MDLPAREAKPSGARAGRSTPSLVNETEGTSAQRVHFVDSLSIGREVGDITIPADPYISKQHVQIVHSPGGFVVQDCGSTNGTFVQIRQPIELRPGDEILIGSQLFRVVA